MSTANHLVGRDAEVDVASTAVRELTEGRASVLVVQGEAGIGKTRLVQHVIDDARARGVSVFAGQAHPFERTRPFGVVASALDLDRRSPDPRRAALGALLTGVVDDGERPTGGVQYQVVDEVVDLVDEACLSGPVLLVAEDVHWADAASLSTIRALVRQLPLAPLLVVVSHRTSPVSAEVGRLLDDLTADGAQTIALGPLGPEDVAALAVHVLGDPPGPVLTGLLDKAGGNPLWAVAMMRSLADEGLLRREAGRVEATTTALPTSLADLVLRRLRDLPPATLELLQVTAVLGDTVSLRDVAAVARRTPMEIVAQLGGAFDAQLLDEVGGRVVFRHQLVHDAIYLHVPASARRLLHREAAIALVDAGADRLAVADHLMLGAERGDEWAVTWLRGAARDAADQAPMVAVDLLHRAEALLPDGHPAADVVTAEVVQALLRAGRVGEAAPRAEAFLARPHADELDMPVRLALLGALALQNRAAEVIAVVDDSLGGARTLAPHEQVPMLAQQSWALTLTGDAKAGAAAATRALDLAEHLGSPALTVWALTALLVALGRQGRYDDALTHARRSADLATESNAAMALPLQPHLFLGLALFDCDHVEEARAAYRQALDDEFRSGWWLSDTLMADAQAAFAVGEWEDAAPALVAAGQAAREKDHALLASHALALRTVIATATGDEAAARELSSTITRTVDGDDPGYNGGVLAFAVGGLRSATGDTRGAYDVLLRCWRFESEHEDRFYHRWLAPDLVRLALALGHRDVAEEVADAVAGGVALAPQVATVRALALRCAGLVTGDVGPLLDAVRLARGTPLLLEHTGACEDAATLLARAGRTDEATSMLAEALTRHEQAGAEAWAARVRARMRALGAHPGTRGARHRPTVGWASLTATERAVAQLVAEGLTNGAVARRLYVSPHTVNSHLRHVYAKLAVPNRVALATVVHHSIK